MNDTSCTLYDQATDTYTPLACNNVTGSVNTLTGNVEYSNYGYLLNHPATYAFLGLYSAATFFHLMFGIYWRTWWTLPTLALGTLVETLGWVYRLMSINQLVWDGNNGGLWEYNFGSFVAQVCCLVIAPTFYSAANYILLGYLINHTNTMYSSLDIRSIRIIFIVSDVVCLVVQAVGGAWAGTADDGDNGAYLMTAGVVLQLVVTVLYLGIYVEWLYRWRKDRPVNKQYRPFQGRKARRQRQESERLYSDSEEMAMSARDPGPQSNEGDFAGPVTSDKEPGSSAAYRAYSQPPSSNTSPLRGPDDVRGFRPSSISMTTTTGSNPKMIALMAFMISFSSLVIVIRSLYRSVELSDGWQGPIAINEPLFLGMDATMMIILAFAYAIAHPGLAFGRRLF